MNPQIKEIMTTGRQVYDHWLIAIEQAKKEINWANFCFVDGQIFDELAQALGEAAKRGVKVRVIADYYGGNLTNPLKINQLRAQGVEWVWYNPLQPRFWRYNHRLHKKLLIIDNQIGFTGGVGVADFWAGPNHKYPQAWRDTHFKLEGNLAQHLNGGFISAWNRYSKEQLPLPPAKSIESIEAVDSLPSRQRTAVGDAYTELINQATKSIDITTPYFGPDRRLRQSMIQAARRGVKFRLLSNGQYNTHYYAAEAGRFWYRRLLEAGVKIYEYQPTKIHAKLMVVDGQTTTIGSANFNFRSFYHDEEFNLIISDTNLSGEITKQFELDLGGSKAITQQEWRNRPVKRKAIQAASTLGRWLF